MTLMSEEKSVKVVSAGVGNDALVREISNKERIENINKMLGTRNRKVGKSKNYSLPLSS